jgi:hypothetical protein
MSGGRRIIACVRGRNREVDRVSGIRILNRLAKRTNQIVLCVDDIDRAGVQFNATEQSQGKSGGYDSLSHRCTGDYRE